MRRLIFVATITLTLGAACGGSSTSSSSPTPQPATTRASTQSASTPATSTTPLSTTPSLATTPSVSTTPTVATAPPTAAASPNASGTIEVTGIVGAVDASTHIISIKPLSGGTVTEISVSSSTSLRSAGGGHVAFGDIHSSDRIIAEGTLDDGGETLDATEITVQDIVPGAAPAG